VTFCAACGNRLVSGAAFCGSCGRAVGENQQSWVAPSVPAPPQPTTAGNGFSVAGIICGAIAFLFFPIVLGPIGIILGAVGWSKGERIGHVAVAVAACGLVFGMIIGAAAYN